MKESLEGIRKNTPGHNKRKLFGVITGRISERIRALMLGAIPLSWNILEESLEEFVKEFLEEEILKEYAVGLSGGGKISWRNL